MNFVIPILKSDGSPRSGLVAKKINKTSSKGKTYQATVWVKPEGSGKDTFGRIATKKGTFTSRFYNGPEGKIELRVPKLGTRSVSVHYNGDVKPFPSEMSATKYIIDILKAAKPSPSQYKEKAKQAKTPEKKTMYDRLVSEEKVANDVRKLSDEQTKPYMTDGYDSPKEFREHAVQNLLKEGFIVSSPQEVLEIYSEMLMEDAEMYGASKNRKLKYPKVKKSLFVIPIDKNQTKR
jgi:hypothetical protein